MKRNLSLIVLIVLIFSRLNSFAQLQVGIMAGPQFATRNYTNELGVKTTFNIATHAGITAFIPLSKELYLHQTIGYSGKGVLGKSLQFTDNVGNSLGEGDVHVLFHYLEFRTPFTYNTSISSNIDLSAGAGLYAAYALGGYRRITGENIYAANGEKKHKIDFELEGQKRFDFGLTAEINFINNKKWLVGLSADAGLIKVEDNPGHAIRNTSFAIQLGYLLRPKKTQNKNKASSK